MLASNRDKGPSAWAYRSVPRPREAWSAPARLFDQFTIDLATQRLVVIDGSRKSSRRSGKLSASWLLLRPGRRSAPNSPCVRRARLGDTAGCRGRCEILTRKKPLKNALTGLFQTQRTVYCTAARDLHVPAFARVQPSLENGNDLVGAKLPARQRRRSGSKTAIIQR